MYFREATETEIVESIVQLIKECGLMMFLESSFFCAKMTFQTI